MSEEQMPAAQQNPTPFQFAFRSPGLSVSVSANSPDIILQYVGVTFGATLPAPELRSALPEDGPGSPNAEALQQPAPKQTRGRAKDKAEEPKKEETKPELAAEKTEPAAAPATAAATEKPEATGISLSKDQMVEMTVACFGKDRAKVSELLGQFGAKRFSELPENKLGEYGAALSALAKELKV